MWRLAREAEDKMEAASRAKCHAGASRLERRVRQHSVFDVARSAAPPDWTSCTQLEDGEQR